MSQELVDRVTSIVNGFDQRVQTAAGKWDAPSPCEGWTARDVVLHVTNNLRRVGAGLGGEQLPEVTSSDDVEAAWSATRSAFVAALGPADWSATLPGPMGQMTAEQIVGGLIANDTLVHTWDLARSTGGDEKLPEDMVQGAYNGLKPMDAMIRRPGVFGDKIEAPAGSDLQTEFLLFLGRKV